MKTKTETKPKALFFNSLQRRPFTFNEKVSDFFFLDVW